MSNTRKASDTLAALNRGITPPKGDPVIAEDDAWRKRERERALPAKPVRVNLTIQGDLYRELQSWLLDAAADLGETHLNQQDAIRGMIRAAVRTSVAGDPVLAESLRQELAG